MSPNWKVRLPTPQAWYSLLVQVNCSVMSDSLWPHGLQHARLPCWSPLPELAQTHVHQVSDAIQPYHPGLSPSPANFNLSQHQGLFQWVSSSHQVAKELELQLQLSTSNEHSGLTSFRINWPDLLCSLRDSQESSLTPQFKSINSLVLSFLYSLTLISIHDYWKKHSFD